MSARPFVPLVLLAAVPAAAARSQSVARDTARAARDTLRPRALAPVTVTVTRTPAARDRAPWAVDVVDGRAARAGRLTVGLDEALADVPGVYVANRYNFSVDQRLSIRGAGARANFGVRGVRVLLDGVPQTLPDGQSQLTNVDLANLERVEVLRGAASSLYGNAAGGVLAFSSDLSAPATGVGVRAQAAGGAFGVRKLQARAAGRLPGRAGGTVGALSVSGTTVAGFRQHSAAEQRRLTLAADHAFGANTLASLRLHAARDPRAENPGALTFAEWEARADSAAGSNILRGADKRVGQEQLSLALRHGAPGGARVEVAAFGVRRDLWNPLATPPPGGAGPLGARSPSGTLVEIGRRAGGVRAAAAVPLAPRLTAAPPSTPVLTVGAEWQGMRDARTNRRATAGRTDQPTDTLVLDQVERVTNLAPFAQLSWAPDARWTFDAAARRDRVRFAVADRFARDGRDDSGARTLAAASGHAGASVRLAAAFTPYANVSTAFETPTTVELQALPSAATGAAGGFNTELGPQRTRSAEVGARGAFGDGRVSYSLAVYRARVAGAIVQFLETNGRAYFRNAGSVRNRGAELGVAVRPLRDPSGGPSSALAVTAAYTLSRFRFAEYRVQSGAAVDTLDGRTVPGVPERFARLGLRARPLAWAGRGGGTALGAGALGAGALGALALDVDHTWASAVYADDRNALRVGDWGRGVLDVRLRWDAPAAGVRPFAAVQNVFGQRYVGAVTVNGANGRVLEPAPGRTVYVGVEVGQ